MLLDEDARGQRVWCIAAHDRYGPLDDNRPVVELRGHQMNGNAGDGHAVLERLAGRLDPWEGRQQGRMDIEDGVGERLEQRRPDQAHVAGKAYQADISRTQFSGHRAVVLITGR